MAPKNKAESLSKGRSFPTSSLQESDDEAIEEEEEEEEDNDHDGVGEDVYALLFAYPFCSTICMYAFFVLGLEIAMIVLLYYDLLQDAPEGNLFKTPKQINRSVYIAKFLVVPLTIFLNGDFKESLYLVGVKYSPRVLKDFPSATRFSWFCTCFLRFLVGVSLVILSIIQIIQATTITDLFLNLEAVAFLGELDNHGYWLAEKNFITNNFRDKCESVQEAIKFEKSSNNNNQLVYRKRFVVFFTMIFVIALYSVPATQEVKNVFLTNEACHYIYVSFGEKTLTLNTSLVDLSWTNRSWWPDYKEKEEMDVSSLNGVYRIDDRDDGRLDTSKNGYTSYTDARSEYFTSGDWDDSYGFFQYCGGRWRFYIWAFDYALWSSENYNKDTEALEDKESYYHCDRWLLRSPETTAGTLEEVGSEGWSMWTGTRLEAVEDFTFSRVDCTKPIDCNFHGTCMQHQCVCDAGYFGRSCEEEAPSLSLDASLIGEESWDYKNIGTFSLVGKDGTPAEYYSKDESLLIYDRPVYIMNPKTNIMYLESTPNPDDDDEISYLYYAGSKWIVSSWSRFDFEALQAPINSFWDRLFRNVTYYSEPTSSLSPMGLNWFQVGDSRSQGNYYESAGYSFPVTLRFRAVGEDCMDRCGIHGTCGNDGVCQCDSCFGGSYCEFAPYEDYARDQFITWFNYGNSSVAESDYYKNYWSRTRAVYACVSEYELAARKIKKHGRRTLQKSIG